MKGIPPGPLPFCAQPFRCLVSLGLDMAVGYGVRPWTLFSRLTVRSSFLRIGRGIRNDLAL